MKLFEEFKLYETLWDNLTEAKADTQKLIDFAGEDLTNRFLAIKNRLKAPENDLYYWIKNKTPDELEQAVSALENVKSITKTKKDITDLGAELVYESEHWKVYHITTFEASQKYGRDTKWCITGVDGYGDKYWNDYSSRGVKFYFLITKGQYNARGVDSKFALAVYPNGCYEAFDQQDSQVSLDEIPNFSEVSIPGLNIKKLKKKVEVYCAHCGTLVAIERIGLDGRTYCGDCFNLLFTECEICGAPMDSDSTTFVYSDEDGYDIEVCDNCLKNKCAECESCGSYFVQNELADNKLCANCL